MYARLFLPVFLLVLSVGLLRAQVVPVTIFYNQNNLITTKQNASVIRVASLDTAAFVFRGTVTDYYANGFPYRQLVYEATGKEGAFQLFHPNKKLDRQGVYLADRPVGQWKFYYPDGKPLQTVEFLPNHDYKVLEYHDFAGQQLIKDGTGQWETSSRIKAGNIYMDLLLEGQWKDGRKTGQWLFIKPDGKKVFAEEYEDGVFKRGKLYDPSGSKVIKTNTDQETEKWPFLTSLAEMEKLNIDLAAFGNIQNALRYILNKEHLLPAGTQIAAAPAAPKVDKMPEFPGGQAAMFRFLAQHFRIMPDAQRAGVHGTVVISFLIGTDGTVSDPKVVKSLHPSVDVEALRVVKKMPKWTPAQLNGEPVPFTYTVPYRIVVR